MPKRNYHSKWECSECGYIYDAPITGTKEVVHRCNLQSRKLKRIWRSMYDGMKDTTL